MFKNIVTLMLVVISTTLCLAGCATAPRYVQPSIEELQAVIPYKKKIAVLEIGDKGSSIRGIGENVASGLELLLSRQFNLVERRAIAEVLAERQFMYYEDDSSKAQLGKLLGADYLVFGNAISSVSKPELDKFFSRDKKGEFHGSIAKKKLVQSDVSLKIIDVSSGLVIFDQKRNCSFWHKFDNKTFNDERAYAAALKTIHMIDDHDELRGDFARMRQEDHGLAAQSIDCAVKYFRDALIMQFPYTGEIMELVSETEVMVNLGSAYGIRPGDKLVVYSQEPPKIDPRTGLAIVQRIPAIILTVKDVTSGISCIAKGRAADIQRLQVGSVVNTSGARR